MRCTCRLYFSVLLITFAYSNDGPEVTVEQGKLRGKYLTTRSSRKFNGFYGIPYAKPPVGPLRFKDPEPIESWKGVRDATEDGPICIQRNPYVNSEIIEGQEDCLYLNVYTPQLPTTELEPLPVMVFFHGGGWICGAGTSGWYGPDFLLEHDVVLVVPNFRLGPLGFLTTGDDVAPGNFGLKDQVFVLKWIKKNIGHFGGDPNRVTLFGESAGGASAHFHMMSPLSKGLFHQVISESGTALAPWALAPEGYERKNSHKLAKLLDCPTDSSEELVECLRGKPAYSIIDKDKEFMIYGYDPMVPFKPVIEHKHDKAFLSEHPLDIMQAGRIESIPWLTGIMSSEGALRASALFGFHSHLFDVLNNEFDRFASISLFYDETAPDPDYVSSRIRKFYFGDAPIDNSSVYNIIDMYTDGWFLGSTDQSVRLQAHYSKAPVYYYYFDHRGYGSFSELFGDPTRDYGVCHADELIYLFPVGDTFFPDRKPSQADIDMTNLMTTMWTNFAKTGNPTPETNDVVSTEWIPVHSAEMEYLHIGSGNNTHMEQGLLAERAHFWAFLPTSQRQSDIIRQTNEIIHEEL